MPAAGAEVEHHLAALQFGEGGRVAAAQGGVSDAGRQIGGVGLPVEGGDGADLVRRAAGVAAGRAALGGAAAGVLAGGRGYEVDERQVAIGVGQPEAGRVGRRFLQADRGARVALAHCIADHRGIVGLALRRRLAHPMILSLLRDRDPAYPPRAGRSDKRRHASPPARA